MCKVLYFILQWQCMYTYICPIACSQCCRARISRNNNVHNCSECVFLSHGSWTIEGSCFVLLSSHEHGVFMVSFFPRLKSVLPAVNSISYEPLAQSWCKKFRSTNLKNVDQRIPLYKLWLQWKTKEKCSCPNPLIQELWLMLKNYQSYSNKDCSIFITD